MKKYFSRINTTVVVSATILALFAIIVYSYFGFTDQYKKYVIYTQESVHGMVITSPVEYRGVTVGEVLKIDLQNTSVVRIVLGIKRTIPVIAQTKATIITRGLASSGFTGYVYISLDNLDSNQPLLVAQEGQPYPEIKVVLAQGNSMDLSISQLMINVSKASAILESIFDKETQVSFKNLIRNLEQVTRTLAVNNSRLNSLIINVEKVSGRIDPFLQTGSRALIMAETQLLPEVYQALTNLNNLSGTIKSLTNKIDRDPSIIIRGIRSTPGPGESQR